jgi:hypothetical protein
MDICIIKKNLVLATTLPSIKKSNVPKPDEVE